MINKIMINGVEWELKITSTEYVLYNREKNRFRKPWLKNSNTKYYFSISGKNYEADKVIFIACSKSHKDIAEAHNKIIIHKNKDKLDMNPKNLKMISRSDFGKLNSDRNNTTKITMLPDGKKFNSIAEAAEYLTSIGKGNKNSYQAQISKVINGQPDGEGYQPKTILGKTFIKTWIGSKYEQ